MSALWLASWVIWTPGFVLSILEIPGLPRHWLCRCSTGWMAERHFKARWLLFIGVSYVASDTLAVAAGKKVPIIAAIGAYYLWRWWKHTKNKRKKATDKALGVVRETAAGLKVVPAPGGAR